MDFGIPLRNTFHQFRKVKPDMEPVTRTGIPVLWSISLEHDQSTSRTARNELSPWGGGGHISARLNGKSGKIPYPSSRSTKLTTLPLEILNSTLAFLSTNDPSSV